eukprot:TRINITY_DN93286_c0_g1_i1.p1 TRINITY_DN93286_c0_g1~~TRINITY_DN93286_c0_g1_i1.p1  ORF type:complete len:270 (+),score=30.42 TRINITY_DN93286_c0_g1_i1:90-899(+)
MAKRTGTAIKKGLAKKPRCVKKKSVSKTKLPSCGRMSKVLTFGQRSSPSSIVVMLHGLNDSAACCSEGVAMKWAEGLEGSLVIVPQSPDQSIWSDRKNPGFDWLRQQGFQDTSDHEANIKELQRVARARACHIEKWLKPILRKYGVRRNRLVISGFSQGSILAAICAVRMNALGAIVCGGVTGQPVFSADESDYVGGGWMRWEDLLPAGKHSTKFCAINGTCDCYVPRKPLERMLERFDCYWHWDHGVGHDFPSSWYTAGLRWMKDLLK